MNEKIIHLKEMGKTVANVRNKMGKSQIEFYRFLFPYTDKEDELIKKKMNAIENGKGKNIDLVFLDTFASKCNCGLDYIFGLKKDYKTYTNEFLCDYFGLNENTINALHKIGKDKKIDLYATVEYSTQKEKADCHSIKSQQHMDKDFACVFTALLDFLFMEEHIPEEKYLSKLSIFYYIYNYLACDAKLKNEDIMDFNYKESMSDFTYMIDSENRVYGIEANDIFLELTSKKLLKILDTIRDRYHKANLTKRHVPKTFHYSVKEREK